MNKQRDLNIFRRKYVWIVSVVLVLELIYIGYPYVSGGMRTSGRKDTAELCPMSDAAQKKNCWNTVITSFIKKGDLDGAFATLVTLFDQNPTFSETCHSLTHEIGRKAYERFARGIEFTVTPKSSYCSYGFYHGFMEELVRSKSDIRQAGAFCAYVDRQLSKVTPDVTLQCYHGIGHGTVNNHDPRTWGNEQKMIDPALSLCRQVATTPDELSRCATGVFNGISVFYSTGEYKLTVDRNDPLRVCRQQTSEFQDACYISMNTLLLELTGGDMTRAVAYIAEVRDDTIARHVMINIASPMARLYREPADADAMITLCRNQPLRLRDACIQGYAYGFLEHGAPEVEYKQSIKLCENKMLTTTERNACFEYILSYMPMWYGKEKVRSICATVQSQYRPLCMSKI